MTYPTLFRIGLLAGVAAIALPRTAAAIDATPAQAAALEQQVRDALGSVLGPAVKLNERPIRIAPAGDHYDVTILSGAKTTPAPGAAAQDIQITAAAHQGEKGVWLIDNVRMTSPLRFTTDVPLPPKEGQRRGATVPVTYTIEQNSPDTRIVWDPSFASPSTWTTASQGSSIRVEGGPAPQTTKIGPVNSVSTLRPVGADRSDVLMDATMQDLQTTATPDSGPLDIGIKRVRIGMALNGVSRAGSLVIIQALTTVIANVARSASQSPGAPPKIAPELVRSILAAMQDFASDFTLDETLDGFIVKTQGQTVALDHIKLGFDGKSESGLLRAGMTMGVEGIALPEMPLGDMAALIPRRVALHPVVGGIGVAELMRIAQAGSENKDPAPADIQALFSHGGITAGLDSLAIEVAGATLTGQGKVVATGPDPSLISGSAQLTVENFDTLMQKVTAIPSLAQQAVPAMVFIKGIGRTVDNKLVYDISYKDNKVLINNVDLTAMAGSPTPAPRPPTQAERPPVPAPSPNVSPKGPSRPVPSWAK